MTPAWLHDLSLASLTLGVICALGIVIHEIHHPQKMWIMNIVWPVTALFGTVLWVSFYFAFGRLSAKDLAEKARDGRKTNPAKGKPFSATVAEAASHCGAGCSLGDLFAETLAVLFPTVAAWVGWHSVFAEKIFAVWVLDFLFAYLFGIVFQYFTIAPMRGLNFWSGLWAAIKADTLSLISWQVGMYSVMAAAEFWISLPVFGIRLDATMPEFWFVMQIAMIFGFITAYPVNWALLMFGLKERM